MANIFEVPQPGNDLIKKADQVRLASIKISQTENQNRIKALNFMADYLEKNSKEILEANNCLLYTSPSPRDRQKSRMPSSA